MSSTLQPDDLDKLTEGLSEARRSMIRSAFIRERLEAYRRGHHAGRAEVPAAAVKARDLALLFFLSGVAFFVFAALVMIFELAH